MGLEVGTWITDLNIANPLDADVEAFGAAHFRLVKSVLQNTLLHGDRATDLSLINNLAALSLLGNGTNALAVAQALVAAVDGQILRRSGTTLGFGSIDLGNAAAVNRTTQTKVKTADTSRASTVVLADDPDIAGLVLEANKLYRFEMYLPHSYATTPSNGLSFRLSYSQTPVDSAWAGDVCDAGAGGFTIAGDAIANTTNTRTTTINSTGGPLYYSVSGHIQTHATLAGTLTLQWAQGISNATPIILKKGAHVVLLKLN
jgi:hypothetical protein